MLDQSSQFNPRHIDANRRNHILAPTPGHADLSSWFALSASGIELSKQISVAGRLPALKFARLFRNLRLMPRRDRDKTITIDADQIAQFGLGKTWAEFRDATGKLHNQDFVVTSDTFGSHLAAVALPILDEKSEPIGSISRVLPASTSSTVEEQALITEDLKLIVGEIGRNLEKLLGDRPVHLRLGQVIDT